MDFLFQLILTFYAFKLKYYSDLVVYLLVLDRIFHIFEVWNKFVKKV